MTINHAKYYKKINIQDFVGDDQSNAVDLKPLLKLLWLSRWVLLTACILGALLGMHMAGKQTPIYKSTLSMLVQPQFANSAQVGQGFVEERSFRYYETQYKIIRSRAVLEKAALELGIVGSNSPYKYSKNKNILFEWLSSIYSLPESMMKRSQNAIQFASIDQAVQYLRDHLQMVSSDQTELLELNFSSPNAQFSADAVNMTATAYQAYTKGNKATKVDKASSWLEKQLSTIKSELTAAESELVSYRSKQGTFGAESLGTEMDRNLQTLDAARTRARTKYSAISQRYGSKHPIMMAAKVELESAELAYSRGAANAKRDRSKEFELVSLEEKVSSARELYNMFLQRYQEANKSTDVQLNDSTIVDFGRPAKYPSNMTGMKTIFLYLTLGFISSITLILLRFHFDNTYRSHRKLEKHLGVPVFGILPKLSKRLTADRDVPCFYRQSQCASYTENVNKIRASLNFKSGKDEPSRIIQITSSIEGEGKSTLSYNLALACAYLGKKTIIIDADMRRPKLHNVVSRGSDNKGLSDWLSSKCNVSEVVKKSRDNEKLSVITSGSVTKSPLELISSDAMQKLIEVLGQHFDCVILDSPPVLPVADALELGKYATTVLLLVESGRTETKLLKDAYERLIDSGITPDGTILSKISARTSEYYYPRREYGYGYTSTTA